MATRRGQSNQDRFGLDAAMVTADASLVLAPCFVYSIVVGLIDTTTTGNVSIADSSASGDADKEVAKLEFKLGAGEASANGAQNVLVFCPPKPWYIQKTLVADITNATVSVLYANAQ